MGSAHGHVAGDFTNTVNHLIDAFLVRKVQRCSAVALEDIQSQRCALFQVRNPDNQVIPVYIVEQGLTVGRNTQGGRLTGDTCSCHGNFPGMVKPCIVGIVGNCVSQLGEFCTVRTENLLITGRNHLSQHVLKLCGVLCKGFISGVGTGGRGDSLVGQQGIVCLYIPSLCLKVVQIPICTVMQQPVILNLGICHIVVTDPKCHELSTQKSFIITVGQLHIIDLCDFAHILDDTVIFGIKGKVIQCRSHTGAGGRNIVLIDY